MADGRNHVPCCIQEKVPDICQDVCRGEYTVITENIKTHFSCQSFTEQTLACIVEGIGNCLHKYVHPNVNNICNIPITELLPSTPNDVEVEAISQKSLKVSWSAPSANHATVTSYQVLLRALRSFDAHLIDPSESSGNTLKLDYDNRTVDHNTNYTIFNDLTPFTMYEVTVTAVNKHGTSLPSYALRYFETFNCASLYLTENFPEHSH
jgi:hypothetical protein